MAHSTRTALLAAATLAALTVTAGFGGLAGEPSPEIASAGAGALLALGLVTATSYASARSLRRGPEAAWRVSMLGTLVRMILVGSGLALAATAGWFRPAPFVVSLAALYLTAGLWVAVAHSASLREFGPVPSGPRDRGQENAA